MLRCGSSRFALIVFAALVTSACAPQAPPEPPFERPLTLERNYGFTFGGDLRAGDVVELRAEWLSPGERLRLQRCGPDCATTDKVAAWEAADFADGARPVQAIDRDAEYYFWVEDTALQVDRKALQGANAKSAPNGGEVTFGGRVHLVVVVRRGR